MEDSGLQCSLRALGGVPRFAMQQAGQEAAFGGLLDSLFFSLPLCLYPLLSLFLVSVSFFVQESARASHVFAVLAVIQGRRGLLEINASSSARSSSSSVSPWWRPASIGTRGGSTRYPPTDRQSNNDDCKVVVG